MRARIFRCERGDARRDVPMSPRAKMRARGAWRAGAAAARRRRRRRGGANSLRLRRLQRYNQRRARAPPRRAPRARRRWRLAHFH
jgi:hypothetical protein